MAPQLGRVFFDEAGAQQIPACAQSCLQIVHGRGDRHRRVTELAQDGEFQVAVAFALATAPPIARDRDGAADDGIEPRHVREGHLL